MNATESQLSETELAIMKATYRALCTHGYANLTMAAIAGEFDKSKSLIHYHYATKQDLLAAFMEFLLDRLAAKVEAADANDAAAKIDLVLDALLFGPEDAEDFQRAMLELRAQAPHDAVYRKQLAENDASVRRLLADTIESGVEAGTFAPVDSERTAELVLVMIEGARTRRTVFGDDDVLDNTHEAILALLHEGTIVEGPLDADASDDGLAEGYRDSSGGAAE